MSEAPDALTAARQPRGIVKANGAAISGWLSIEIDQNEFYNPDTFRVEFALNALPAAYNAAWWGTQTDIEIEILVGFPKDPDNPQVSELTSLFVGDVDEPEISWDEGTLTISGRDKTHLLIDHKSSAKYVNLTSSQIAQKLAAKYGLKAVVTATKTKAGKYYQIDHVNLKDDKTEWDLLTWLASKEKFDVYVKGNELHFGPRKANQKPYVIKYTPGTGGGPPELSVGCRLKTSRTLTVAKDIEVAVRSWNSKHKKSYTRRSTSKSPHGGAHTQKYTYSIPGLTPGQVQARADQIRDELSKHEFKLELDGPADLELAIDVPISLQGTGTAFDQTYWPESINRTLSTTGGFEWRVSAKNHNPESTPSP